MMKQIFTNDTNHKGIENFAWGIWGISLRKRFSEIAEKWNDMWESEIITLNQIGTHKFKQGQTPSHNFL